MKPFIYIIAFIAIIIIAGCSPLDINTPRQKVPMDPVPRVTANISDLTFVENGASEKISISNASIQLDTTKDPPIIWLHLTFTAPPVTTTLSDRIDLGKLEFQMDSIALTGAPILINPLVDSRTWANFNILRGYNKNNVLIDTTMPSGIDRNFLQILINFDRKNRQAWTIFNSNIYDYKLSVDSTDTIVTDTTYVTKYDTVWVNGQPVVTEKKVPEYNQLHLKITNDVYRKDSLFIYSKFRINF